MTWARRPRVEAHTGRAMWNKQPWTQLPLNEKHQMYTTEMPARPWLGKFMVNNKENGQNVARRRDTRIDDHFFTVHEEQGRMRARGSNGGEVVSKHTKKEAPLS